MVETTADVRAPPSWMYVNEMRLFAMVLGASIVVLGIGVLVYVVDGADQLDTVDVLLGTGVFFLLFAIMLFIPRLRSRGPLSYSVLVEYGLDEVESAVIAAVEGSGRTARVTVMRSRFPRPPREVAIEGVPWSFVLRAAPYRERRAERTQWSEIVQKGLAGAQDEVARELRERVLSRLATSVS